MKIHILGICGTFMGGIALLAREMGIEVYLAGDCLAPRTVEEAVFEGFKVGLEI